MQQNLLSAAEAAVAESGDPMVELAWQEASFERLSAFVSAIGERMGLGDADLDNLFDLAKTIN